MRGHARSGSGDDEDGRSAGCGRGRLHTAPTLRAPCTRLDLDPTRARGDPTEMALLQLGRTRARRDRCPAGRDAAALYHFDPGCG